MVEEFRVVYSSGPGNRIAGFEVIAELGRVASGEVYLARETALDQ